MHRSARPRRDRGGLPHEEERAADVSWERAGLTFTRNDGAERPSVWTAQSVPPVIPMGSRHRTAFFTSPTILFSSASVSSLSAQEVGHMAPWSMFASSLKPKVA